MNFKKILNQLNIIAQCRRYGIPLWQCPQLLFLAMGAVIIISSLATYIIGARFIEEPELVTLIVLGLATILFILGAIITQSFDRLAEANRMKSEFINIVSHQLRSPLTNLSWTMDALLSPKKEKVEEEKTEYFNILKENIGRMKELVNALLIVSRIQEGTLPLKRDKFSLAEMVKEIVKEFKFFADASNAMLEVKFEEGLPEIIGDSFRIKSVVENLLNNAIRYAFKEEDRQENRIIGLTLKKLEGEEVYFEIKDNGIGIPKEDQKYIFQKFFRAGNVLKNQTMGSGLGLYIAKSIIEKSGGKIGFKSEENKGSTFWFTLPLK